MLVPAYVLTTICKSKKNDHLYQAQVLVHVNLRNTHKTDKQYREDHRTNIWKLLQTAEERLSNSAVCCYPTAKIIHDDTRQNDLNDPIVGHYQGVDGSDVACWSH